MQWLDGGSINMHIVSGELTIVDAAAALLKAIVTRNPKAMIRLYSTGAFYFALALPWF